MLNWLTLRKYSRQVTCRNCGKKDHMIARYRDYRVNPYANSSVPDYIWMDIRTYECIGCNIVWNWERFELYGASPITRIRRNGKTEDDWEYVKD